MDFISIPNLIQKNGLDEVIDENLGFVDSEILRETQVRLTPSDNESRPTNEVYVGGKEIWNNKAG